MNAFYFARINRRQRAALCAGVGAMAVCGTGAIFDGRQAFISYLFAYLFWLGLSLGCLCVAMIHHVTGGRWGEVTRRFLEGGYMTLPLTAILFLPILEGVRERYHPDLLGFAGRAACYFFVWITLARTLRKWSLQQDHAADLAPTRSARALSGPGIVIYFLTVALASIDGMMALNHDYNFAMLPAMICAGQILATFAFVILLLDFFQTEPPFLEFVEPGHFRQLGHWLMAVAIFFVCLGFGHSLPAWHGHFPRDLASLFLSVEDDRRWTVEIVTLFSVALPILLLFLRATGINLQSLRMLAGAAFVGQLLATYWLVRAFLFPYDLPAHWLDMAAVVGVGGLWLGKFAASFKRAASLPEIPGAISSPWPETGPQGISTQRNP